MMKCKQVLIVLIVLNISLQSEAQDFIYKKNGDIVTSKVLETSPKSISYQIPDQLNGTIHYLSTSAIDSIIYRDGQKAIFPKNTQEPSSQLVGDKTRYNHHLIGFDLAGWLIYQNYTVSYEFLPGKAIFGFKVSYMQKNNASVADYYKHRFDWANSADWKMSLGTNIYLFAPRTFRFGTGLHYVFGEYSSHWYVDKDSGQMMWDSSLSNSRDLKGLSFSALGFYNISKNFAVNIGTDVPVTIKPKSTVSFRLEALLNF